MAKKPLKVTVKSRKTGKERIRKTIDVRSSNRLSAGIEERVTKRGRRAIREHEKLSRSDGSSTVDRAFRSGYKAAKIKARRRDRGPRWPSDG